MDGNHVVLDVSSDEDVGFNWAGSDGCGNDVDWSELFMSLESDAGRNQNCDKGYESDDVVVVGEVLAKPKRAKKSSGVAKLAAQYREEDDDCVMLDGDPNKSAVEDRVSGGESDDLVVVAEKGQVACRDYPHPRHLCVKFPFYSTLHPDHCTLCHCYVCDSPAPCAKWGNGHSKVDHCHATEKEELWESERKRAKQANADPAVSTAVMSFWRPLDQIPQPNSGSHSYFPGQAPSYDPPNIIRSQRTAGHSVRTKYRSKQPNNRCSNKFQRARVSSISPHSVTSSPIHKRPRPLGRASEARASLPSRQARGNSSVDDFRHAYSNHLMGIHLASKRTHMRQQHTRYLHGAVNSGPNQNLSAVNASQISTVPIPSQVQNQNGNISAPISSNPHYNTSQSSQCFTGDSDLQGGERLQSPEEQPWYGVTSDLQNWELDTQFLDGLPVLDAEDGIHADCPWPLF